MDTAHLPNDWENQPDAALLLVHIELELAAGWDGALQDVTGGYTYLGLYHPDHRPEPC